LDSVLPDLRGLPDLLSQSIGRRINGLLNYRRHPLDLTELLANCYRTLASTFELLIEE
jgi:hypothetical protein